MYSHLRSLTFMPEAAQEASTDIAMTAVISMEKTLQRIWILLFIWEVLDGYLDFLIWGFTNLAIFDQCRPVLFGL